eukprot:CAMPEP_0116908744 /NCGR_PEP_ID=MMETSP0467-20121206/13870_1 /TAXON_ID=283647 /ORGANISM="Mesodinium pulex, Strain SPMC105" /LENGTH=104 /DNA_ID=CAMNT_0004583985 /DNA_START=174 /DNA_END=488 /DNA_ORIENTATION=+
MVFMLEFELAMLAGEELVVVDALDDVVTVGLSQLPVLILPGFALVELEVVFVSGKLVAVFLAEALECDVFVSYMFELPSLFLPVHFVSCAHFSMTVTQFLSVCL